MFNDTDYFYNKNLRKLVVAFGSLFSNIYVSHEKNQLEGDPTLTTDNLKIRVPITYAPQEKFIRRLLEPSSITDGTRIETQLPKMSYIINSIMPDPSRRKNKLNPVTSGTVTDGNCDRTTGSKIYEQVPVNAVINLFIYTRHIDDTLQIFEQIVPFFNPDHIIQMDMNEVQSGVKIPITMTGSNLSERYDGDLNARRINISSISFSAKTYIYGPVQPLSTIQTAGFTFSYEF
jgi:hypothetical protein